MRDLLFRANSRAVGNVLFQEVCFPFFPSLWDSCQQYPSGKAKWRLSANAQNQSGTACLWRQMLRFLHSFDFKCEWSMGAGSFYWFVLHAANGWISGKKRLLKHRAAHLCADAVHAVSEVRSCQINVIIQSKEASWEFLQPCLILRAWLLSRRASATQPNPVLDCTVNWDHFNTMELTPKSACLGLCHLEANSIN